MSGGQDAAREPRFLLGERVKVVARTARGHCRTPWYLRGRIGTIATVHGVFRDPERLAYHRPGLPALMLYTVRFSQADLWPGYTGATGDQLDADIYENWLAPASRAGGRKTTGKRKGVDHARP